MLQNKVIENQKIRPVVVAVAIFIATMLIQTPVYRLGTIFAFGSILLIMFFALYEKNWNFKLTDNFILLVLFIIMTFLNTNLRGYSAPNFWRMTAQIICCGVLFGVDKVSEKEEEFLTNAFVFSSAIYAVFVIISCNINERTFHGDIVLWGTEFDPNFIGIPFVATTVISAYKFLFEKHNLFKRILYIAIYIECAVTIMFTASRGNFLAWMVSNGLLIVFLIFRSNFSILKKIIICIVVAVAFYFLISKFKEEFPRAWERMMSIGEEGSDNGRFDLWGVAFNWWKQNPIFGGGLYSNYLEFGKATHNTYFQILSETGLIGSLIFLKVILNYLINSFRYNKMYFCLLFGTLLQIMFLDALDNRIVWAILFWFALLPKKKIQQKSLEESCK
ncbi:MAG: hypothetical protein E7548_00095 [Ruminococcaceae bacterium]|nr:hypothetical protein [Oscillospiraceae bacterium]